MPRYYFHIRFAGEIIADRFGRELPGPAAAQNQARDMARHLLSACGQHWRHAELHVVTGSQEVTTIRLSDL